MEGRLKVAPSCQYPGFKTLLWAAAQHLASRLQQQQLAAAAANGGGCGSNGGSNGGRGLYGSEVEGVSVLVEALQAWRDAGEGVPQDVEDPEGERRQLCQGGVLQTRGGGGVLYGSEVDGVPMLVEALQSWRDAGEGVPQDVEDPEGVCGGGGKGKEG